MPFEYVVVRPFAGHARGDVLAVAPDGEATDHVVRRYAPPAAPVVTPVAAGPGPAGATEAEAVALGVAAAEVALHPVIQTQGA